MPQIRTHYDNLKVSRNAPPEVIRAAYKALSQRYHPDRNPDNAEAARIMVIINNSYDVLSDPTKRNEHDLWIKEQENKFTLTTPKSQVVPQPQKKPDTHQIKPSTGSRDIIYHLLNYWYLYGISALIVWILATEEPKSPPAGPKPYQATPNAVKPAYVRPTTAPNGKPWPSSAGYIQGYQRLHTEGLSTLTVDNSQNDSDVFVKLVSLDGVNAYPVRQFYIPAFGSFTIKKITAGNYDIRYRDLSNGSLSRSESFYLEEIQNYDGVQYSNLTITLYKIHNGNMQTYGLSESEF